MYVLKASNEEVKVERDILGTLLTSRSQGENELSKLTKR